MNGKKGIILFLAVMATALIPFLPVRAGGATFRDEVPQGFSGAEFPLGVSYFDRSGVLWVFWMEDSRLFYSSLTDTSRWDITTSYKDYMKGPELTTWKPDTGPPSLLTIVLAVSILVAAGIALKRYQPGLGLHRRGLGR